MDISLSNQLQAPDDEEDRFEELEDGDNFVSQDAAFQETFFSYYHHRFQQQQNPGAIPTASSHGKIQTGRLMQEGFNLASPKLKAKRRKAEIIEVHGGRMIRPTGRKDKHSKVCTSRGTRDRRVRLSPKTAIQFYDVQDRLGFDRPSKAIDWLMKEAKAAIDALDEPPPVVNTNHCNAANVTENHTPPNGKTQQMQREIGWFLKSECGMSQNLEHLNDDNPISSFGFLTNGAEPLSLTEIQPYPSDDFNSSMSTSEAPEDSILYPSYQGGFLSAPLSTIPSQIFDTNLEMARLQRVFTWNYDNARGGGGANYSFANSLPLHSPAPNVLGHSQMFSQREPLQSSITHYSPLITQFPNVSFSSEELPNFTAAATLRENEMDKIPVSSRPSSTASLLHYQA